jgi:hypothetical protein
MPNVVLWHNGVLTEPALKRAIKADVTRATTALAALVTAHRTTPALIGFGDRDRDGPPGAVKTPEFYLDAVGQRRITALSQQMTALNERTMAALRERKHDPAKYATDGQLAARFTAQNVYRKLGI